MQKILLNKNYLSILSLTGLFLFFSSSVFPSDLSDARTLRERCEREMAIIEVSVKNFGDNADAEEFTKGEKLVKLGNVKFIQTKYSEAIDAYNQYLNLQFKLYERLANKYTENTGKLIDEIAEDLVDFIDNKKVVEYLRLANQNLKDAKSAMATKHYKNIIDLCRNAKNYAISAYKLVGKDIPEQYKKDAADNDGKIFK